MNGTLYTVSKKPNSTAQPSGAGTTITFSLKGACSVQAPVLSLWSGGPVNLFSTADVIRGFYMSSTGTLATSATYCVSDYIPITAGTTYTLNRGAAIGTSQRYINYYDVNLNRLGSVSGPATASGTFSIANSSARYIRFNYLSAYEAQVQLTGGTVLRQPSGNYLHIPAFGRYYWITDMSYNMGEWEIRCRCDVLATYKTQIGSSSQYVLRSASAFDTYVMDTLYPTRSLPTVTHKTGSTVFDGVGTYIMGVIGRASGGSSIAKGLTYYALTPAQMQLFVNWINDWNTLDDFATNFMGAVQATLDSFAGQLLQIFDYIRTVFWVPISYTSIIGGGSAGPIVLGGYTSPNTITAYPATNMNVHFSGANPVCAFYLPAHSQAATEGYYLNAAPFLQHVLDCPYIGEIQVPSMLTAGNAIVVNADISVIDGSAEFYVFGEIDGTQYAISRINAQIGVPIPLSTVKSNVIGTAGAIAGTVASAVTGNFLGAAAGIADAVSAAIPTPKNIGGLSGYHTQNLDSELVTTEWSIVNTDNTSHGRPLCQVKTISTLSGYVLCENAEIAIPGTAEESEEVMSYMNGGFYYE